MTDDLRIRPATKDDCDTLHALILELAGYEGLTDTVRSTPGSLREDLFVRGYARAFLAEIRVLDHWEPVGFAVTCDRYSTFQGRRVLYLEDILVRSERRSSGIGSVLFGYVLDLARDGGYARVEWSVLPWNEAAKAFYRAKGGRRVEDWEYWALP